MFGRERASADSSQRHLSGWNVQRQTSNKERRRFSFLKSNPRHSSTEYIPKDGVRKSYKFRKLVTTKGDHYVASSSKKNCFGRVGTLSSLFDAEHINPVLSLDRKYSKLELVEYLNEVTNECMELWEETGSSSNHLVVEQIIGRTRAESMLNFSIPEIFGDSQSGSEKGKPPIPEKTFTRSEEKRKISPLAKEIPVNEKIEGKAAGSILPSGDAETLDRNKNNGEVIDPTSNTTASSSISEGKSSNVSKEKATEASIPEDTTKIQAKEEKENTKIEKLSPEEIPKAESASSHSVKRIIPARENKEQAASKPVVWITGRNAVEEVVKVETKRNENIEEKNADKASESNTLPASTDEADPLALLARQIELLEKSRRGSVTKSAIHTTDNMGECIGGTLEKSDSNLKLIDSVDLADEKEIECTQTPNRHHDKQPQKTAPSILMASQSFSSIQRPADTAGRDSSSSSSSTPLKKKEFIVCTYPNGDSYEGEMEDGKRCGMGKYTYNTGEVYEGNFQANKFHGQGKLTGVDGKCYEGEFVDNKRHGLGLLSFPNGDLYEGEFLEDLKHGYAKYECHSKGWVYEGEFQKGKMCGQGTQMLSNGDKYEGEFSNGKFEGIGIYYHANGNTYEGQFKNGASHGEGKFVFTSGDVYIGSFKDGLRSGEGEYRSADGTIYKGTYDQGMRHGIGHLTMKSGDIYKGEFRDGRPNGKGRYELANGDIYEGEVLNDRYHGYGIYISGQFRYEGQYVEGKRHGQGKLVNSNGSSFVGEFIEGSIGSKGTYNFASGDKYEGEFQGGKPNGQGVYRYKSGQEVAGIFLNGQLTKK